MFEQVLAEVLLQNEEVLVEQVQSLHFVLLLYPALPQAHELPLVELLEEGEVLNVVVGVALDQPLAQGHELNGCLLLIERQAFARDCIVPVATLITHAVTNRLQIIRVVLVLADEVCEDRFFLAAGV